MISNIAVRAMANHCQNDHAGVASRTAAFFKKPLQAATSSVRTQAQNFLLAVSWHRRGMMAALDLRFLSHHTVLPRASTGVITLLKNAFSLSAKVDRVSLLSAFLPLVAHRP
jgi:hypothetical protein